jgi:outer membrane protein TolC
MVRKRLGILMLLLGAIGCTRTDFRWRADRQVYGIEQSRMIDWRWNLPERPVEAHPNSRIGDPTNPDRYPIPLDDPAARLYQVTNGLPWEFAGWKKRGVTPVENADWQKYVPTDTDGAIVLDPATSMQVFMLNSRNYQTDVENVYLAALNLTLTQYQFVLQPFAGQTTNYSHFGAGRKGPTPSTNQLQLATGDGANLMTMTGAQILSNFANAIVFQWSGKGPIQIVTSGLVINVTQPLLQNAFARIVTQPLSAAERNVLYAIRNFAEQRRAFYVQVEGTSGFLGLLTALQSLRNQESQVKQYRRSLEEYEALVKADLIDPLQRDNIAVQYQGAQLQLISLQASLQTQLDEFKLQQLAIPPNAQVRLDDSKLKLFELSDPRFDRLRTRNDEQYLQLLQFEDPPTNEVMADHLRKLLADFAELERIRASITAEYQKWDALIPDEPPEGAAGTGDLLLDKVGAPGADPNVGQADADISREEVRKTIQRQAERARKVLSDLNETRQSMADDVSEARDVLQSLGKMERARALEKLRDLVGKDYRGRLAELFVAQTQIRVYLIELPPVDLSLDQALMIAVENRLDLKNSLAQVTDAWRNVEFFANQLRGILNLNYQANLNKVPGHGSLVGLDEAASSNLVGIQFQAPLVRRAQRNEYRTAQITYQRARRAYMQTYDTVLQEIRLDMRQLALFRRQFEINREQLLIATRQVDQAEYNLRNSSGASSGVGQSVALNLQNALSQLLNAKNGLVFSWASYLNQRMTLYQHFDLMNIDAQGVWTNERNSLLPITTAGGAAPAPAPTPGSADALPPPPAAPGPFAPH